MSDSFGSSVASDPLVSASASQHCHDCKQLQYMKGHGLFFNLKFIKNMLFNLPVQYYFSIVI